MKKGKIMEQFLQAVYNAEIELKDIHEIAEELPQRIEMEDIPDEVKNSLVVKVDQLKRYVLTLEELVG